MTKHFTNQIFQRLYYLISILANTLDLDEESSHPNPFDESRPVFLKFDIIHGVKNCCWHILDDVMRFEDGTRITKQDFEDLQKITRSEVSCGKFRGFHINVKKSDRMRVKYARKLLNRDVAILFLQHFPNCPRKKKLAEFLFTMYDSFKILKSKVNYYKNEPMKSALEANLE